MNTSWIDQDHEWEAGAKAYAVALLEDEELRAYAERVGERAERIVLGQTLLKLTVPGVPDLYQGDELPFLALVDPDNRRPVDWELRRRLLGSAERAAEAPADPGDAGASRPPPGAFTGSYEPLDAGEDVCAFTRGGEVLVAVALRGDLRRLPATRVVSGATSSATRRYFCPNGASHLSVPAKAPVRIPQLFVHTPSRRDVSGDSPQTGPGGRWPNQPPCAPPPPDTLHGDRHVVTTSRAPRIVAFGRDDGERKR